MFKLIINKFKYEKSRYKLLNSIEEISFYEKGKKYAENKFHIETKNKADIEIKKQPKRTEIINFLLKEYNRQTTYLEIGVRNPEDNFNKINATEKYSVDPGIEFESNPVDFKFTSDVFFEKLQQGDLLEKNKKFDVIFIDGLHLADQVDRDIQNALLFIKDDGFIILHDCNPPTQFHASEEYYYRLSPSEDMWNGTTWKAFFKARQNENLFSCCVDTDWGIGIISKTRNIGLPTKIENPFYEYKVFENNRKESLNLISFDEFKDKIC